ncbi:MAG: hypothetical protein WAM24_18540 [Ignavibacteriaceae bacterium]
MTKNAASVLYSIHKIFLSALLFVIPVHSQDPGQSIMDINNITLRIGADGFHDWLVESEGVYFLIPILRELPELNLQIVFYGEEKFLTAMRK